MPIPSKIVLYQLNPQKVTLSLKDATTLDYIDTATITAQVVDARGNVILDNLTFNPVVGSNPPSFEADVPATFTAPVGVNYRTIINSTAPINVVGHWEIPTEVRVRNDI